MRILVTGAGGFVGGHLARELRRRGHEPCGFDLRGACAECTEFRHGDLLEGGALEACVAGLRPEGCIHLAGMASVPRSWSEPDTACRVNLEGTARLLLHFARRQPRARILVVTSSEIYGVRRAGPLDEEAPPEPVNPYALSKAAADGMALMLAERLGLDVMTARPENHIGPGQSEEYVAAAFARQVARIAAGADAHLRVGNLESRRAFCDVRDVARAYRLLLERGRGGRAYNISSGPPFPVRDLLDRLCRLAGVAPAIEMDPARYRPTDSRPALDCRRLCETTGWAPRYSLDETLRDLLSTTGS